MYMYGRMTTSSCYVAMDSWKWGTPRGGTTVACVWLVARLGSVATYSLSVKFGPVQLKIWFQWFDNLASLCIIVPSQSLGVTVDAYIYCCIVVDTVVSSLMCAAQR